MGGSKSLLGPQGNVGGPLGERRDLVIAEVDIALGEKDEGIFPGHHDVSRALHRFAVTALAVNTEGAGSLHVPALHPASREDIVGRHEGGSDAQAATHFQHYLGVAVGGMVRQKDEAGSLAAGLTEAGAAAKFQILDKVPPSREGKFPNDQLGKRNQERTGLGGDELVGKISEIQHRDGYPNNSGLKSKTSVRYLFLDLDAISDAMGPCRKTGSFAQLRVRMNCNSSV